MSGVRFTRKHSGWPFTEENFLGEFVELPRAEYERLAEFSSAFPLYELIVGGAPQWLPLRRAGVTYDSGLTSVVITGWVLDAAGSRRQITEAERAAIADIADEWSGSK